MFALGAALVLRVGGFATFGEQARPAESETPSGRIGARENGVTGQSFKVNEPVLTILKELFWLRYNEIDNVNRAGLRCGFRFRLTQN